MLAALPHSAPVRVDDGGLLTLGQVADYAATFQLPTGTISSMTLNLELAGQTGATGMIHLYNYNLAKWVLVRSAGMQIFDVRTAYRPSSWSAYVSAGNEVKVRVRGLLPYRRSSVGPRPSPQTFPMRTDQLSLNVRMQ